MNKENLIKRVKALKEYETYILYAEGYHGDLAVDDFQQEIQRILDIIANATEPGIV